MTIVLSMNHLPRRLRWINQCTAVLHKGILVNRNTLIAAFGRLFAATCAFMMFSGLSAAAPVPLPDPGIKGYKFPEDKDTLMHWVNADKAAQIHLHGWGIWTSLTAPSGQAEFGMPNVPVYLTWLSPAEIADLPQTAAGPAAVTTTDALASKRIFKLEVPRQFSHGGRKPVVLSAEALAARASLGGVPPDTNILVTMGYSPAAQAWAQQNNLFSMKALQAFYNAGTGDIRAIPTFPIDSVAIKPTYKLITKANLIDGHLYKMPAWPGTPTKITPAISKNGYPETSWPGCVYVDINNFGKSSAGNVDSNCKGGPKPGNTYGLGDFVNYPVTAANVASFESLFGSPPVVGDVVLLMAMHVTSREIDEWTWQTFFWTPNPAAPPLPSSGAIARARPPQLKGAAAHYAMSIGYQMVAPNQPITGGHSVGMPVTAYNPYLESGFGTDVFGTPPVNPGIQPKGKKAFMATVGVQSNCMTCHGNATVSPTNSQDALPYLTNFYVSRDDPAFKGFLQVDFLWSIQGTAK